MLKLYNSKINDYEEFKPLIKDKVSIYVCGPTVYNDMHLGNLRPIIVFDVLHRYFKLRNYEVQFLSNFTDIDDKIIDKALAEGVSEEIISERYIEAYRKVVSQLGCLKASKNPRVTNYISEIISAIELMLETGFAYKSGDDIYFSVDKLEGYGKLSNQDLTALQSGKRIEVVASKQSDFDFVLWKKTSKGVMYDAPFGKGRPGWHTECVVMIKDLVDKCVDIHAGGSDLLFPHHENEVAQSLALDGTELANYWLHNGMLMVDSAKMSKSLGNVLLAKDLLKDYDGNVVRLSLLQGNYRQVINYNEALLEQSIAIDEKIAKAFKELSRHVQLYGKEERDSEKYLEIYEHDLNTSNVITYLLEMIKEINTKLRQDEDISNYYEEFKRIVYLLGLTYSYPVLSSEDKESFKLWKQYRSDGDFESADAIRTKLKEKGLL